MRSVDFFLCKCGCYSRRSLTSPATSLGLHYPCRQHLDHLVRTDFHQIGHKVRHVGICHTRVSIVLFSKCDISKPEDGCQHPPDGCLFLIRQANDLHRSDCLGEIVNIVDRGDIERLALARVGIGFGTLKTEHLSLGRRRTLGELVEDVEVSFAPDLAYDSTLLRHVDYLLVTGRYRLGFKERK